jgi:3-oxoacyl-[acyl-carrier protein] reductase
LLVEQRRNRLAQRPTWEYAPQAFIDVVHVGLIGTFYVSRSVIPHMIAQNYGRIVNVSSIAGQGGQPRRPPTHR